MNDRKALVKNAADKEQVKEAAEKEKSRRTCELEDLKAILATPHGRRFLWRLLAHCSVFRSIWEPSAKIHHNAGRQDVGHFVMAEIIEADEDAYMAMMKENRDK